MKVYGYQLSQATMRVRIALNLKKVDFQELDIDLLKGDQFKESFTKINPQQVVPAVDLEDQNPLLFQSMAILEYFEEAFSDPPLLPADLRGRARVRGLAQMIIADTHRSSVPSTRKYLTNTLGQSEEVLQGWINHWVSKGLEAFESRLRLDDVTGRFCHGDSPTFADLSLFPQILGAKRFDVPTHSFPIAMQIFDRCMDMAEFKVSIPDID